MGASEVPGCGSSGDVDVYPRGIEEKATLHVHKVYLKEY